jgi:hypothetical protein
MKTASLAPASLSRLFESCLGKGFSETEDISQCSSAIATMMAIESQYVFGAATLVPQQVEITSGHAANCQRCQHQKGGEKRKNPLTGYF